jgi:hypothetical protein
MSRSCNRGAKIASRSYQVLATALCLLLGGVIAAVVITRSATVYDEGAYPYHGWAMFVHGWRPFADFHMKVLPLVHLLYGLPQALLGPDMLLARYTATFFTVLTVLLAALLARRLAGNWAAIVLLALFASNLEVAVRYYRSLCMAPTALFFVLALYWMLAPNGRSWQYYAASLATAAIVLCRHDMLLTALVLWAFLWLAHRKTRPGAVWGAIGTGVGLLLAVSAYYYSLAPLHFKAVMVGGMTDPQAVVGGAYIEVTEAPSVSQFVWYLMMFARAYTGPILLLAPALGAFVWRILQYRDDLRDLCYRHRALLLLIGAAAANYIAHLAAIVVFNFRIYYMQDFYIFFPIAIAAAVGFVLIARSLNRPVAQAQYGALAVAVIAAQIWANGIPAELHGDGAEMKRVSVGAQAISRIIPPGEYVFSLDDPHQFLQSGRLMHPLLTYQLFHYVDSENTERLLHSTHYYNKEILGRLFDASRYAVISDGLLDWMVNSGRYDGGEKLRDFVLQQLERDFRLVETVEGAYMGPTRIYERHR